MDKILKFDCNPHHQDLSCSWWLYKNHGCNYSIQQRCNIDISKDHSQSHFCMQPNLFNIGMNIENWLSLNPFNRQINIIDIIPNTEIPEYCVTFILFAWCKWIRITNMYSWCIQIRAIRWFIYITKWSSIFCSLCTISISVLIHKITAWAVHY